MRNRYGAVPGTEKVPGESTRQDGGGPGPLVFTDLNVTVQTYPILRATLLFQTCSYQRTLARSPDAGDGGIQRRDEKGAYAAREGAQAFDKSCKDLIGRIAPKRTMLEKGNPTGEGQRGLTDRPIRNVVNIGTCRPSTVLSSLPLMACGAAASFAGVRAITATRTCSNIYKSEICICGRCAIVSTSNYPSDGKRSLS